jgi:hypothetical protein
MLGFDRPWFSNIEFLVDMRSEPKLHMSGYLIEPALNEFRALLAPRVAEGFEPH